MSDTDSTVTTVSDTITINGEQLSLIGHCYAWHGQRRSYTILAPSYGRGVGVYVPLVLTAAGTIRQLDYFTTLSDALQAACWDDQHA